MTRAPAKPATLAGRVVRASDGVPIGRAVVAIAAEPRVWDESVPPVIVTSGSDGRWSASDVAPGAWALTVTAVGFVPHTRQLVVAEGEQRSDLDVALPAGGALVTGTITTETHEPIANARVRAYRDGDGPRFVAFSGPDGRYQISLAPGSYQLEVTHDDYRRAWHNVSAGDEPITTADFVLVHGGVIRGVVIARDTGQPLAGAAVEAVGGGDASFATTGSDGAFTLRGLHDGRIAIHARGRGYASVTPATAELELGEQASDVRVMVDPAGAIVGRVVAKDDPTRGIGGVGVRADGGGFLPASAVTDPDGDFEMAGLPPGSYWLSADKRGMLFENGVEVAVAGTDVTDVTIEMRSGATVWGRVEPPAAAQIALARPGGSLLGRADADPTSVERARAETDAAGAFTLRAVPAGDVEITAMARDGSSGRARVTIAQSNHAGLVIRLTPRASVSGRVVDDRGRPVAGAYVSNLRVDAPLATRLARDGIHRGVTTTSDGAFKLVGLDAGTWKLGVDGGSVEVELADGEARAGVTITTTSRDEEIRGTVLGLDRKPASGAQVRAMREVPGAARSRFDFGSEPVRTDAAGRFVIGKLPPGTYVVDAKGARAASMVTARGVKTGETITIALEPLSSLTITVTRGGAPAHGVQVICAAPIADAGFDAEVNGSHTFTDVAQGEYRCEAYRDDGSASASIVVRGDPATLELALAEHATLTGIAIAALSDHPVAGITVMARGASAETDASGRFILERVHAGTGELLLRPTDQHGTGFDRHPYTARPGQRVDLGRLAVVPPRTGEVGTFGLGLEVRDDALFVVRVKPGSAADRAGLEPGDSITALDGRAVTALGPARAQRLLTSEAVGAGQTVTLLLGNGARVSLTAVRW